jgi:hypothetical protein
MDNKAKAHSSSRLEIIEFDISKPFSDEENEAFFGDWKPIPQRLADFQLTPQISTIAEFHARELACLAKTQVIELPTAVTQPPVHQVVEEKPHEHMASMLHSISRKQRRRAPSRVSAFVSNYHQEQPEQSSHQHMAGIVAIGLTVVLIGACALLRHQEQQTSHGTLLSGVQGSQASAPH